MLSKHSFSYKLEAAIAELLHGASIYADALAYCGAPADGKDLRQLADKVAVLLALRPAVYLGDGRVQIGDDPVIALTRKQGLVIQALLLVGGGCSNDALAHLSACGSAYKIVDRILADHPELSLYLFRADGKGNGGIRTTIRDGRKKCLANV
jgi:hypothetical protein